MAARRPGAEPVGWLGGPHRRPGARWHAGIARSGRDPGHGRRRRPRPGDRRRRSEPASAEPTVSVDRSRAVAASLDLRGARVDEALDALDRYLDEASVAGMHKVLIIHGRERVRCAMPCAARPERTSWSRQCGPANAARAATGRPSSSCRHRDRGAEPRVRVWATCPVCRRWVRVPPDGHGVASGGSSSGSHTGGGSGASGHIWVGGNAAPQVRPNG